METQYKLVSLLQYCDAVTLKRTLCLQASRLRLVTLYSGFGVTLIVVSCV